MDSGAKGRARLWLRAERALGVDAVPLRVEPSGNDAVPSAAGAVVKNPPAAPAHQAPTMKPMAAAGAQGEGMKKKPTDLFGKPIVSSAGKTNLSAMPREPFSSAVLSTEQKRHELAQLDANFVKGCTRCGLCETRTNTVFGEGDVDAKIFFVGEGPGENEDLTGRPFVGRAGNLLDKMIVGMGLAREQVYIANIVKCRPPGNRVPQPDEADTCMPYLDRQIEWVRPNVIVTLGLSSAKYLLRDPKLAMGKIRGQWNSWRGIKLMPTFHPSYVLRVYTPEVRRMVWDDLQRVMDELGLTKTREK